MIKQILIILLLITNIYANNKNTFCKDLAKNNTEYIKCLVKNTDLNPTVKNINFLAGVYAVNKDFTNAIKYYKKSEDKGNKKAIYYQAGIYNEEIKDTKKAIEYFSKIKDYKDSTCQIGKIYYKTSEKEELAFYDSEIKNKNYEAAFCKGKFFLDRKKYYKAEKYYKVGAKYYNVNSTYALGSLFTDQKKNVKKAMKWYKKAYELGHLKSANNIGKLYLDEYYDLEKAYKWAKIAADAGLDMGAIGMATIHRLEGNKEKSIEVLIEYGDRGFPYGYTQAGIYYEKYFKDFENAKKMFLKSLEYHDSNAAAELAFLYYHLKKDNLKAEKWYKKSYEMGLGGEKLGILYYQIKKFTKAKKWFKKLYQESRNPIAAAYLGHIYRKKEKNFKKAEQWYLKAHELGYISATFNLGYMYKYNLKDNKNAIIWFKKTVDLGDIGLGKAQYQLHKLGVKYDAK